MPNCDQNVFYTCKTIYDYRSRATAGRSRLVAAPLSFQAKNRFLCAFYVAI